MMHNLLLPTALTFALSLPAFATGEHSGGHDDDHATMAGDMMAGDMMAGIPGDRAEVTRTIEITMRETDDGEMLFEPQSLQVAEGETIRFAVVNKGELEHEFVIDTMMGNAAHKEAMARMNVRHDDPNSVRLDAGASGDVIWTFSNSGRFEFACLIPGHYESGMHGAISVDEK